jgi:hypothetical protein
MVFLLAKFFELKEIRNDLGALRNSRCGERFCASAV